MNQTRSGAAVAVVGDLLYAIGGHDGPEIRKSVEVYEPVSDTWTLCSPMICARRNAGKGGITLRQQHTRQLPEHQ